MRAGLLVLVALLATACGPGRLVRRGRVNDGALAVVQQKLPTVRGLEFRAPVTAVAMSPEEITAFLSRDLDRDYTRGELERVEAVCARLGLLPPDTRLRPALEHLYEQEGAGFYDPRAKRLVLATRQVNAGGFWLRLIGLLTGRDVLAEFVVAHELTHALQDQHFGLPTTPEPLLGGDGDRRLAQHAVIEGDATFAGFGYALGRPPDRRLIARAERELKKVPAQIAARYPEVPALVRETVAFVYDAGATFVGRALAEGGFPAVDRLLADPPTSSEQVMHPERYYEHRDPPVAVALAGTEALERAGFVPILDGPLGEFHVRLLAAGALPAEEAAGVAAGWGGDRLRALERGQDLVLVWLTAWDTEADAAEFSAAMPASLRDARVEQRARRVLVLLAPPGGDVDVARLAGQIWAATRG